jgi:magnesium-transporting ATPase (P-type)
MFLDAKVVDASVNWQIYQKAIDREMAKDEAQRNLKKVVEPGYDIHDVGFQQILMSIALNTTAFFTPSYTDDDIVGRVCKQYKASSEEFTKNPELKQSAEWASKFQEAEEFLKEKEEKLSYLKKNVKGDASETGLIKFAEPILLKELKGLDFGGVNGYRESYPVVKVTSAENKDGYEAVIPFSSDIKFNLLIRDLNKECLNPSSKQDNVAVFLKGAPERVLSRCTKILKNGQEIEFTDDLRSDVNTANLKFGGMGERVLAFAKKELEPEIFVKGQYQFDTK